MMGDAAMTKATLDTMEERTANRETVDAVTVRIMDAFVERLGKADLPEVQRVLLYGSRARGNWHEESDVDIAVVFRGEAPRAFPFGLLRRLSRIAHEAMWATGCAMYPSAKPVFEAQIKEPSTAGNAAFFESLATEGIEWALRNG